MLRFRSVTGWLAQKFSKVEDEKEQESPRLRMLKRYLHNTFICTVNPHNKNVYDFQKKKMRYEREFPRFGYVCPKCGYWDNYSKHYLIGDKSLCEKCALLIVEYYSEERLVAGLKPRERRRYLKEKTCD